MCVRVCVVVQPIENQQIENQSIETQSIVLGSQNIQLFNETLYE